MEILFVKWLFV